MGPHVGSTCQNATSSIFPLLSSLPSPLSLSLFRSALGSSSWRTWTLARRLLSACSPVASLLSRRTGHGGEEGLSAGVSTGEGERAWAPSRTGIHSAELEAEALGVGLGEDELGAGEGRARGRLRPRRRICMSSGTRADGAGARAEVGGRRQRRRARDASMMLTPQQQRHMLAGLVDRHAADAKTTPLHRCAARICRSA